MYLACPTHGTIDWGILLPKSAPVRMALLNAACATDPLRMRVDGADLDTIMTVPGCRCADRQATISHAELLTGLTISAVRDRLTRALARNARGSIGRVPVPGEATVGSSSAFGRVENLETVTWVVMHGDDDGIVLTTTTSDPRVPHVLATFADATGSQGLTALEDAHLDGTAQDLLELVAALTDSLTNTPQQHAAI